MVKTLFEKLEENIKRWAKVTIYLMIGGISSAILQYWEIIVPNLSNEVIGFVITCIGIAVIIFYVRAIGKDMSELTKEVRRGFDRLVTTLNKIPKKLSNSQSKNSEEEEEIKTSGAGALAGMIGGGAIGLIGGPIGVLVGGIIGALIGYQLEYEQERERRKAERERKKNNKLNL